MTRTRTYKTDAIGQRTEYRIVWYNAEGEEKTRIYDKAAKAKGFCEFLTDSGIEDFETEYTLTKKVSWRDI